MKCVNPRKLRNKAATGFQDAFIVVACGKCYACLANRRRSWLFRLKNEQMESIKSYFCTFTYNDENCDGYVHKKDMQDFFKRLRHYFDLTYYCIGEYGTHTLRPHYHAVIFLKSFDTENFGDILTKLWSFGFVQYGICSYRRLNYVLHYHVKPKELPGGRNTFQLFSKGLGLCFLNAPTIEWMVASKNFVIKSHDGGSYVVPRYYRKKLIDLGYDIDSPERVFDADYGRDRIEKVFGKPIYQISDDDVQRYLHDLLDRSLSKVNKYNHQDKF